jgi:hypothetical protein
MKMWVRPKKIKTATAQELAFRRGRAKNKGHFLPSFAVVAVAVKKSFY